MNTWADDAKIVPPGLPIDRDADEGPPRCCARRFVAADALVCYDELAPERRTALLKRFPHLSGVSPLYLCDACGDTLVRERVITREERAIAFGLSAAAVAKARAQDLGFLPG
jgi:hypothetical protein